MFFPKRIKLTSTKRFVGRNLCEICGEHSATGKAIVDGIKLNVCEKCTKFGKEVTTPTRQTYTNNNLASSFSFSKEDILPNYNKIIRKAREKKRLSFSELAKLLNEKQNVLENVEKGKMLPDQKLQKKLEKFFDIKLTGIISDVQTKHLGLPKATLGDIANIKIVDKTKH